MPTSPPAEPPPPAPTPSPLPRLRTNPRHAGPLQHLTIVIKLGTSSIVTEDAHHLPKIALLSAIVETVCHLRALGHRVVIVSSGAIGIGLKRMELVKRPKGLAKKQALAAIGQGRLIALWDNLFSQLSQPIAQILLTRGDISDRTRYLNAVNTFAELLDMGVVPIVNENDTVSVSEIKFGDNDTLSAVTAAMVHADYLFLMTDVDCLYTDNPRKNPDAQPVKVVTDIGEIRKTVSTATLGSALGTGGMETKLIAAELATGAGVTTVITHGAHPTRIFSIVTPSTASPSDIPPHTTFTPKPNPLRDRKWWILHGLHAAGEIIIDAGAHRAVLRGGGRLLAAGVVKVQGVFAGGQAVKIVVLRWKGEAEYGRAGECMPSPAAGPRSGATTPGFVSSPSTPNLGPVQMTASVSSLSDGPSAAAVEEPPLPVPTPPPVPAAHPPAAVPDGWELIEVGRGLANYNSADIDRVKGLKSSRITEVLGYADSEHVVEQIVLRSGS